MIANFLTVHAQLLPPHMWNENESTPTHLLFILTKIGKGLNLKLLNISFLDFLLAVGTTASSFAHKLVEKYEFDTKSWILLGEYPFDMVQTIFTFIKKQN